MEFIIFDVEANGLLDTVTELYCLSYQILGNDEITTLSNKEEIRNFIEQTNKDNTYLVGHNIEIYDIPLLEKMLDINISNKTIDTIGLSWYLYPEQDVHGLEYYGDKFNIPKVKIDDWKNLSLLEYIKRCERDVEINTLLFKKQLEYLDEIYEGKKDIELSLMQYLTFKLDCIREQEENKIKIDINLITESLSELESQKEEKVSLLSQAMPSNKSYKTISKPSKMYKKDGTLSVRGKKWLDLLEKHNYPEDYEEDITILDEEEVGNPNSHVQMKEWLFDLGWEPITFEYRKNVKGQINKVPQIYNDSKEVCDSIKALFNIEPALRELDMLTLINHRITVFKAFLREKTEDNFVSATIGGFTNTLRFKHKLPICNLPKIKLFYGREIRGSLIKLSEEYLVCGSDVSSLEDTTKQHYMYFFDPEYVKEMRVPGFDPHVDIGLLSGIITEEEAQFLRDIKQNKKQNKNYTLTQEEEERFLDISDKRSKSKGVNFSAVYGAGPSKISLTSGLPLEEAKLLHKIYWKRNKAVKQIAKSCKVKKIGDQMWLYNPLSKFWYSLRSLKDRFSTLNQGRFCSV